MIRAENLSFGFADKDLYHTISFTLEAGRHCALIGSNGTGKTTLADIIRRPDHYLFDGTLETDGVGRVGFVSQFASREKGQEITVFEYLSGDFRRLQEAIDDVCARMEETEDLDTLLEEYQVLLDESESMDADNYETNIRRQLHLAELEDKADLELSKLSGGEYKLIQVIRQMLLRPGLLVMDEPDVFLDFENLNGLRDLVNAYEGTLLVITHSRYLLAHCFDKIWHLENADLQEFDGNFRAYNLSLLQKKIDLQEAAAKDLGEIQRVTELVERLRDEATKIVDPLKGRTLKGKVSYLERLQARQIKAPFVEIRQPEITLPAVEVSEEEEPKVLLEVNDYSLAFSEKILENVSFTVSAHQKVAIVGPNGTGKTTLLRELWQNQNPAIRFHPEAKVGFFSQLQEERLNENNSIYQEFYEAGVETPAQVEALLARYCFDPDSLGKKIGQLSGGEKNLLQLAKLSISGADLLLLDEPSSHLDTYAQMALEEAVANYKGAVLMVSHDFYSIVNCADAILYVDNGTIRPMSGRAFRKMIYKRHFSREYLELELKKSDLETKVARCLEAGDWETAKVFFEALAHVVEQM